ncbi:MAG: hypothetical protein ACLFR1_11465 [Spirochaetia bacterium]
MDFSLYFLGNSFFWVYTAVLFLGAAASRLTLLPSRRPDPDRARRSKPVFVLLYLSLGVASFSIALLLPNAAAIFEKYVAYICGSLFVLVFMSFRFKRAVGMPALFVIAALWLFITLSFTGWVPVYSETEAAVFRVLNIDDDEVLIEYELPDGDAETVTIAGSQGFVSLRAVSHNGSAVFLNAPLFYRDLSFSGSAGSMGESSGRVVLTLARLPMIDSMVVESGPFLLRLLHQYRVFLTQEGEIEVRTASSVLE